MKYLKIKSIVGSPDFGGCKPVFVIAEDNKEYLLKFRDDGNEKDMTIFSEYLAYSIIDLFNININTPKINFLIIENEDIELFENAFENKLINYESLEFAKKSIGTNLGILKIENPLQIEHVENNIFFKNLKNMDNFILNNDRTKGNSNILKSKKDGKLYAIDFGWAFASHRIYENIDDIDKLEDIILTSERSIFDCNITLNKDYLLKIVEHNKSLKLKYDKLSLEFPYDWEIEENDINKLISIVLYRMKNDYIWNKKDCENDMG